MVKLASARQAHRWLLALTVAVLAVDMTLLVTGIISPPQALLLFLAFEIPLTCMTAIASWRAFRAARRIGLGAYCALEEVFGSGPVKAASTELNSLRAVYLFIRKGRSPSAYRHITYGRGLMGTVAAFLIVTIIEIVVLHLLIPVEWVRTLLTIIGVYAFIVIMGLTVSRIVYPHFFTAGSLVVRQGAKRIVDIELANISAVVARRRIDVIGLYPSVNEQRLRLPSQDGTNLDVDLIEPVRVVEGLSRRLRRSSPGGVDVRFVSLHVDDPTAAVAAIDEEMDRADVR